MNFILLYSRNMFCGFSNYQKIPVIIPKIVFGSLTPYTPIQSRAKRCSYVCDCIGLKTQNNWKMIFKSLLSFDGLKFENFENLQCQARTFHPEIVSAHKTIHCRNYIQRKLIAPKYIGNKALTENLCRKTTGKKHLQTNSKQF